MRLPMSSHPHSPANHALRTELRALWQFAWPLLIGQLATVGMAVADVAMAGHASAQDLAGVSLGASIWIIVVVTLMGVMMSVNPLVAHHVGAKEFAKVPHLVRQALWMALGVGAVAMVLANLSTLIFDHMTLEPAVRIIAQRFVHITSFGLPAFAAYRVLYGYSASLNQTKPMMVISLAALLLNCPAELAAGVWQLGLSRNWVVWAAPGPRWSVCGSTCWAWCGGCGAARPTAAPGHLAQWKAPRAPRSAACCTWVCPLA